MVWSKAGGADAAAFELSESGVLELGAAKDFEVPDDIGGDGTYELTVQVSDDVNDVTADVVVTLANVIELEAISGPEMVEFAENSWSRVATFTASSPQDRDGIVWTLGGDDAAHFSVDSPSGALRFDLDAVEPVMVKKPPDFEAPVDSDNNNTYVVTLLPSSGSATAASALSVTVMVTDADEDGSVSLSTKRPRKGVEVTAALADPDGVVDGSAAWTWERTAGNNDWVVIAGADSSSYTPVAADAGSFLRVGVSYSDRHGSGGRAQATAPEVVAAAQLSTLSISTDDSVASTDAWRRMRPAFNAQTLHYSVGCNDSDTMTLTMSAADGASRVSVDGTQYANPGAGASLTATRAVTGDSVVRIALADAEGAQTQYVVHCLPDDFGEVTVERLLGEAKVLDELILYFRSGRVVIMDSNGVPRVHSKPGHVPGSPHFRFYPDGGGEPRYSHRGPGNTYRILDANLEPIGVVRAVAPLTRADGHDFRVLEDGNYMLMAYQDATRDLSHLSFDDVYGNPFGTQVYVEDSAIQIVTPSGSATFNWSSWDWMPLEDCAQHFFPPVRGDYAHLNAMQWVDGRIIASMRGCSRVLAIDVATGDVVWRVGLSNLSDEEWAERGIGPPPLDIVGDPEGQFCGQHASSLLPNGNLVLYDNGVQCTINPWTRQNLLRANEEYSRALEYALDLDNGEAVFVRAHSLHGTESEVGYRGGNVELLSNGHWLVSWGASRGRNPTTLQPTDVFTQVDPDTGDEWLSVRGLPNSTRGTVMRPEYLAEDQPQLAAQIPDSTHTSVFHSGAGDAARVVLAFNRPVVDFMSSTPSLSVEGATITSVAPHHLVTGEPANAYLVTLAPDGAGAITLAVVAGRGCDDGGICAADGTMLATVPEALVIGPEVTVSFGAAGYGVGEGATLGVPVVLSRAHGAQQAIEVTIVASALSASADDFSVAASVSFAAGETRKTVSFDAADDALVEGPETVELSFSALASGFSAGSPAVSTVTIADTDAAVIGFSTGSSEVSEGGETELTFTISNGVTFAEDQAISIAVAGTAIATDDFVLSDSGGGALVAPYSVTLEAGASSVAASLMAVDDSVAELAETVTLSATLASTSTLIGSRTVTIAASDLNAPEVTIAHGRAVAEGDDAVFALRRTATVGSPLSRALTVAVEVTGTGGILSGSPPSTVTFVAGDSTAELRVATVDDLVVEYTATVTVTAQVVADTADPPAYETGTESRANVTVLSDDVASFSVSASAIEVVEGGTVTVTVSTGGVTFARAQSLSVDVGGTATLGDDFVVTDVNGQELPAPYQLTLGAGAGSVSLRVASAADDGEDDGETVVVSVGHDLRTIGTVTVILVDPNDPPVVSGGREFKYEENAAAAVASFTASDAEGDTIDWSPGGVDGALFDVAGGVLGFRDPPDYEKPADAGGDNVYNVTVRASDSGGTADHVVVVTVTNADEAATITSDTGSFTVAYDENAAAAVAAFTATDPELAIIRWSLGGADGAVFEISGLGVLSFLRPPDFEHPADNDTDNEYLLQVQARAGASDPVAVDVRVNVANIDEPGLLGLPSQPQVATALTATLTDPDGGVVVQSWTWQRSTGGGAWFDIATASASSYTPVAADEGYHLRVEAVYSDGAGTGTDTAAVEAAHPTRAEPVPANNPPDFGDSPAERAVAENSTVGAAVGAAVAATDPDPGDNTKLAYTLSGPDADLFTIDGATGQISVGPRTVLDYEAVRSHSVTVTATDPSDGSGDISVTINVTDVNEPPLAQHDTATTAEDRPAPVAVLANDTDPEDDTLTVVVRDRPLHGRVTVQADKTLLYTPQGDFNGQDVFTYTASDGRLSDEATVTVTVNAVNDQPKFSTLLVQRSVADGAQARSPVGPPVTAADVDGDPLSYSLFEIDAPFFTIDEYTGQIRVAEGTVIDRSAQSQYRLRVEATDPHGARVSTFVNVTVTATATATGGGGGGGGGGGAGGGNGSATGVEISGAAFAAPGTETAFSVPDAAGFETLIWAVAGPGGFSASGDGERISFSAPTGGIYTVTVTATDADGETLTATATLAVFGDIAGSLFADEIVWLASENITVGCARQPLQFCPNRAVTRAQMATFLTRALGLETPPQPAGFADVDPDGVHAAGIEALHAAGITVGCARQPLQYCPNRALTRAQMASFLKRALGLETPPQPAGFADVDPDGVHAASIEALLAAGITRGCGDGTNYCPNRPVTRAQMAAFLHRARHLTATADSDSSN